jgi:hypothetical protein
LQLSRELGFRVERTDGNIEEITLDLQPERPATAG